jgi:small ligand-binding sensory domain FIST
MNLYGVPDHDTRALHHRWPAVPVGGFFCSGEIGPVGGTTYLHGYTSSFGLFVPRTA